MAQNTTEIASCTAGLATRWNGANTFKQVNLKKEKNRHLTPYARLLHKANGNIDFEVLLNTPKVEYKVNISKSFIYEMMKIHLAFRPIRAYSVNNSLNLHPRIKVIDYNDLDIISVDEIRYKYNIAVSHLGDVIRFSDGKQLAVAQAQLQRLIEREVQIKALEVIKESMVMPFKSQYRV